MQTFNACKAMTMWMEVKRIARAGITHPFGDERSVQQAFPSAIPETEADPFLMCDYFDAVEQNGPSTDPNHFPVDWHPHKGFSIASYLKSGTGRHGDSLGNRETFATPGMQWMNTGSGVEHAEGGANEIGQRVQGFQIWINVPSQFKLDDPEYGTVDPSLLPSQSVAEGVTARVLAGTMFGRTGPFRTKQDVQMIDFDLEKRSSSIEFDIDDGLDTAMVYVYEGSLSGINNNEQVVPTQSVILLDASDPAKRGVRLVSGSSEEKTGVLVFSGKKIKEPIAWRGPIVMNTHKEIVETFMDLRSGRFPPVRVDWDYKRIETKSV
jgi:redox-sensitive bicupin YhaK (pirin superfamily)